MKRLSIPCVGLLGLALLGMAMPARAISDEETLTTKSYLLIPRGGLPEHATIVVTGLGDNSADFVVNAYTSAGNLIGTMTANNSKIEVSPGETILLDPTSVASQLDYIEFVTVGHVFARIAIDSNHGSCVEIPAIDRSFQSLTLTMRQVIVDGNVFINASSDHAVAIVTAVDANGNVTSESHWFIKPREAFDLSAHLSAFPPDSETLFITASRPLLTNSQGVPTIEVADEALQRDDATPNFMPTRSAGETFAERPFAFPSLTASPQAVLTGENFPDNSVVGANSAITKNWTFKNSGTVDWTGFRFYWVSGNKMGATPPSPNSYWPIPDTPQGGTVTIPVKMQIPASPTCAALGNRGVWQIRDSQGNDVAGGTATVVLTVNTPTPSNPDLSNAAYAAPANPFASAKYGGQCTAFAWGRAKERIGKSLSVTRSAKYWLTDIGTMLPTGPVGSPAMDSIAVWGGDQVNPFGHVAYVESAGADSISFREANYDCYDKATDWGGGLDIAAGLKTLSSSSFKQRSGAGNLLGYIYLTPPVISSLSPASEKAGSTITINGSRSGDNSDTPTNATYYVKFGSTKANVTSWTNSAIVVVVPSGAGTVPVTVTTPNGTSAGVSFTFTSVPSISSYSINNNTDSTTSRTVTLNNSASGTPTYYTASESSSFSGAVWQSYSAAPTFTLSSGNGTKTVYFKVKNATGESPAKSDSIALSVPLTYNSTPAQGTYTTGGNVLRVKVTFSGTNATFTVSKQDGSKFTTSGTMTIRAGAYNGCVANGGTYYWSYSAGLYMTSQVFNLSNYSTSWPKDLYAAIGKPATLCDGTPPTYYSGKLTITAK